jgi:hypothetical protein
MPAASGPSSGTRPCTPLVWMGTHGNGVPVWLDRHWVDADVRITTGFVEPHFFAGFSGGPKMVAPGLAGLMLPPHPAALLALPYHRFHRLGVERRRSETIRFACSRAVRLEETLAMDAPGAMRRLTAFPGVGPWTAAIVCRLSRGDPDAIEVGDYNLPRLVAWNLAGEPDGDDERMLELLAPYAGHRGRVLRLLTFGGDYPPRRGPRMAIRNFESF